MDFSAGWILSSLVVGTVGFGLFLYGKRATRPRFLLAGVALMAGSVFVPSAVWMVAGSCLVVLALWLLRHSG